MLTVTHSDPVTVVAAGGEPEVRRGTPDTKWDKSKGLSDCCLLFHLLSRGKDRDRDRAVLSTEVSREPARDGESEGQGAMRSEYER